MRSSSTSITGLRFRRHVVSITRTDAWVWGIALTGILAGACLAPFDLRIYPAAIAVLGLAPMFLRLDRKTMPDLLFGPAAFMYLYHAFGYAVGPIGQVYVSGLLHVGVTQFEEGLILAQWGAVLGLLAFAVVYHLVFRYVSSRYHWGAFPKTDASETAWAGYGMVMLAVATAILTYGYVTGAGNRLSPVEGVTAGMSTVYAAFQYVHQVMFFFLAFVAARLRGRWAVLWLAVYLAYSLFFLLDGGRGTVATAGLISAIGWVAGGTSSRKVLGIVLVAGIAFIPLSGVVYMYRNAFIGASESLSDRWSGFVQSAREFHSETSVGGYGAADVFLERATTFSVDRVFVLTPREIPFAGTEGIENVIYALVPRVLIPDRPVLVDGNELAIRYGAAPPDATGNYMPAVGDGYRRFGWPGIVLIYAFAASLFASIAAVAYSHRTRREWMAMLVFTTLSASEIMITTLMSGFKTLLWEMPKYLVFFWFLRWLQDVVVAFRKRLHNGTLAHPRFRMNVLQKRNP